MNYWARGGGNPDTTQAPIVAGLRKVGASVTILSAVGNGCPDLLVGWKGVTFLGECKSPKAIRKTKGDGLRKSQREWMEAWRGGPVAVWETLEDALRTIGFLPPLAPPTTNSVAASSPLVVPRRTVKHPAK